MNGTKPLLVDTNIFIFLLQGNKQVAEFLSGKTLYFSVITEIELLGVTGISKKQQAIVSDMLRGCQQIGLTDLIAQSAISIKQKRRLKVPDAIIAATALASGLALVTADRDFSSVTEVDSILFEA